MLDCISIKWPFVPATQRLEIHKQLTQTNPRRASVLGVSVIRKRLIAVPALTCAAAINTDIKIDVGRHPALTPLLFFFVLTLSPPSFSLLSSAHHRPQERAGRAGQLDDYPFHVDSPQPSVHQRHQPGLQGQRLPSAAAHHAHWQNCQSWTCSITYPL